MTFLRSEPVGGKSLRERIEHLLAANPYSAPLGITLVECDVGHAVIRCSSRRR